MSKSFRNRTGMLPATTTAAAAAATTATAAFTAVSHGRILDERQCTVNNDDAAASFGDNERQLECRNDTDRRDFPSTRCIPKYISHATEPIYDACTTNTAADSRTNAVVDSY